MVEEYKKTKETEFNSSLETLKSIRNLINQYHNAWRGVMFVNDPLQNNLFILSTLECIFDEVQTKFDEKEMERAEFYRKLIIETKAKWGSCLFSQTYTGGKPKLTQKFCMAWGEIKAVAQEYKLFLMRSMDTHGMLLTEKAAVEDAL